MKTLISKSLAAAFAIGALFAATQNASAETIYFTGGNYSHCDRTVEIYRGDRCYDRNVIVHYQGPVDRGCYQDSSCYHQPACYRDQSYCQPSEWSVTRRSR